ncbi:hypothetical protein L249_2691 [Ophiocordyceps polyrhachis-furcata BCC 54312]|uniref:Uncharacterized protein n=1 Tax=Ophiocordyceps polyrhachis-furcata BCC 54312 TaxID=1330021 RepID=A0A367LR78_9HYPO|nr:hypothetical protein L249_2691 [Ophiocordyceps polyrhachis-furcata BCC 54312]
MWPYTAVVNGCSLHRTAPVAEISNRGQALGAGYGRDTFEGGQLNFDAVPRMLKGPLTFHATLGNYWLVACTGTTYYITNLDPRIIFRDRPEEPRPRPSSREADGTQGGRAKGRRR